MQNELDTIEPKINHKAGRFVCNICDKRFRKPCLLRRHEVVHTSEKPFKCTECNKQYTQKASLQRHHMELHGMNKKPYQCTKCTLRFSQKTNLQLHDKKVHLPVTNGIATNAKGYACEHCPSVYCNKQKLSRHKNAAHKNGNSSIPNLAEAAVQDDLVFAQNVLQQLKTFQIEMESYELPSVSPLEISKSNATHMRNAAVEAPQRQQQQPPYIDEHGISEINLENHVNAQTTNHTRVPYACEFCGKHFHKSYNFIRHCRVHTRERPYKCAFCAAAFSTKTKLHEHMKLHRLDEHFGILSKVYPCAVCCQAFSSLRQLDKHARIHAITFTLEYKCKICDAAFKTSTALSSHKHEGADEDLNYLKPLLPKPEEVHTTNTSEAEAKAEKPSKIKPNWKCAFCGRICTNSTALNKHQRIYHGAYNRSSHISNSYTTHYFKCAYCVRYFKKQTLCNAHMLKHLKCLLNTEATNQQGKSAANRISNIINGLVIVTERATNVIAIVKAFNVLTTYKKRACAKNLEVNNQCLRSKKRTHQLQYKCHFCASHFQKVWDLKRHTLIHTGERLYNCSTCSKSFTLKSTLKEHQLIHVQERTKCVCIVCGKEYSSKKALNVHLRLHTGKQPFNCEQCVRHFRTSGQKIAHMRLVHNEVNDKII